MSPARIPSVVATLVVGFALAQGCKGVISGKGLGDNSSNVFGPPDAGDASAFDASDTDASSSCAHGGCAKAVCGNGHKEQGEQCDDGNTKSGDGCDKHCMAENAPPTGPVCGDGVLDAQEECDDGNTKSGDGCDSRCRVERCGNGRVDQGEDCDPPVADQCDPSCHKILPDCGDGVVQTNEGEECDDGNTVRGDGCDRCRKECGNGILERDIGETCEPSVSLPGTCNATTCQRLPLCGDGTVDVNVGEQCDPSDGVTCIDCKLVSDAGALDAGAPEGQCVSKFPQIRVINGTFSSDLSGWMPVDDTVIPDGGVKIPPVNEITSDSGANDPSNGEVTATFLNAGANDPGSVEVTFAPGVSDVALVDGVFQCVPVQAGVHYTLGAEYENPASNGPGVLPGISIQLFDDLTCEGSFFSGSGPTVSSARDTWISFTRSIDTSALGNDGHLGSMLVKLGVIVPAGTASGTLRFDDVTLGSCGNCILDEGEACDDGNTMSGDGCSPTCQFECGNGQVDAPEMCDDGNFTFGDTCTPSCRTMTACDTCAETNCQTSVDACLALDGVAEAGPRKGMPRSALCSQLRDCIHDTGCNLNTAIANRPTLAGKPVDPSNPGVPENCYCGTAGVDCLKDKAANGSCRAQVEAALETEDPYQIMQRVSGANPDFPLFAATTALLKCEQTACTSECAKTISCGDGIIEDRTQTFASQFMFQINRTPQPCLDEYTHTKTGCSFEECDDGNLIDGDGCDSNCFVEACGNNLKQGTEECDDGNLIDGDGCDSNCKAEFVCGDGMVNAPFEQCEPPGTGTVCSLDQYTSDPTTCGCDGACQYKVCGNDVVQEGEDCDPPNGASCDATCHFSIDSCTKCILRIDDDQNCPASLLLNGTHVAGDPFGVGCLQDPVCMDLWNCERESLCANYPNPFATCYCGPTQDDVDNCESPSFVPVGACKDQILTAFQAQWGRPPTNNQELVDSFFLIPDPPASGSFVTANYITNICLVPDGAINPSLSEQLTNSGVPPDEVDACVAACFP